jgi:hypothetical protein
MIKEIKGFFGRNLIAKEWLNDPELTQARKQTCYSCKNYNKDSDSCKICKCLIDVKSEAKVNKNVFELGWPLEDTHCPVGKWPIRQENGEIRGNDLDITNYYRTLNNKGKL